MALSIGKKIFIKCFAVYRKKFRCTNLLDSDTIIENRN